MTGGFHMGSAGFGQRVQRPADIAQNDEGGRPNRGAAGSASMGQDDRQQRLRTGIPGQKLQLVVGMTGLAPDKQHRFEQGAQRVGLGYDENGLAAGLGREVGDPRRGIVAHEAFDNLVEIDRHEQPLRAFERFKRLAEFSIQKLQFIGGVKSGRRRFAVETAGGGIVQRRPRAGEGGMRQRGGARQAAQLGALIAERADQPILARARPLKTGNRVVQRIR
jgi:hypothetical protein